jgi:hypothetical protein
MAENQLGISIQEGIANGLNLGSTVNTRNIGLLMERERGVPNVAHLITSPNEDQLIFGGHNPSMYSPLTVKTFFKNLNGFNSNLYGIRLVGAGTTEATAAVMDSAGTPVKILDVFAGRQGKKDPGAWGNDLRFAVYPKNDPFHRTNNYVAVVIYRNIRVETFSQPTFSEMVNDINLRSNYVMAEYAAEGTFTVPVSVQLAGGVYVAPDAADFEPAYDEVTLAPKGLALFDGVDVQILGCPEIMDPLFHDKCRQFANDHKMFYVFNMPLNATDTVLANHHAALVSADRNNIASFVPWIQVDDTKGGRMWIPGIGYYLAAGFVRTAALNNSRAWTPPAGMDTVPNGVYKFTHDNESQQTLDRWAKLYNANSIKFIRNRGFVILSSRTYSSNPLFHSIHVSLLTNYLVIALLDRNARFLQRLNTPALQKEVRLDNMVFMKNIYDQGGLEGTLPFDEACQIDVQTSVENRKDLFIEIAYVPTETTEGILVRLNRNDGILVANV